MYNVGGGGGLCSLGLGHRFRTLAQARSWLCVNVGINGVVLGPASPDRSELEVIIQKDIYDECHVFVKSYCEGPVLQR